MSKINKISKRHFGSWQTTWLVLVGLLLVLGICSGCSGKPNQAESANLINTQVDTYNEGSEDSQFVKVHLVFDRSVRVVQEVPKSLHITIAGNRLQNEVCFLTADFADDTAVFLILPTTAVTNGKLKITAAAKQGFQEVVTLDSKVPAMGFEVERLIPSGVELKTVAATKSDGILPATVVKQVEGRWNIRSITWLQLLVDGQPAPSQITATGELLAGAVALHGHEFLTTNTEMITQDMVATLIKHYGEAFTFSYQASQITVEKKLAKAGESLDLVVYLY